MCVESNVQVASLRQSDLVETFIVTECGGFLDLDQRTATNVQNPFMIKIQFMKNLSLSLIFQLRSL